MVATGNGKTIRSFRMVLLLASFNWLGKVVKSACSAKELAKEAEIIILCKEAV
jgi:hypothetical protein